MAREILFKAKRIENGEWVEGYPLQYKTYWGMFKKGIGIGEQIDENTLCQFTGLLDKNGNKIWENDVIGFYQYNGEKHIDGVVKYGKFNCSCCYGVYGWYVECGDIRMLDESIGKTCVEVFGNLFDNPELLGGAE